MQKFIKKYLLPNSSNQQFDTNENTNSQEKVPLLEEKIFTYLQMLDHSDNIVMLCDTSPENNILYMNQKAKLTFKEYELQFSKLFNNFQVASLENNSIHKFHHDPLRIRKILGNQNNLPHTSIITLGEVTFKTKVFPIYSKLEQENPIYFMASWENITSDLALDKINNLVLERKNFLEKKVIEIKSLLEALNEHIIKQIESTYGSIQNIEYIITIATNGQSFVSSNLVEMKKIVEHVKSSSVTINQLAQDSSKITEITHNIEEIGERSNLLSINASLEAARAGNVGNGFAIVAQEVNRLSEKTTDAALLIKSVVKKISSQIKMTADSIDTCKTHSDFVGTTSDQIDLELKKIIQSIDPITRTLNQIIQDLQEQSILSNRIEEALKEINGERN